MSASTTGSREWLRWNSSENTRFDLNNPGTARAAIGHMSETRWGYVFCTSITWPEKEALTRNPLSSDHRIGYSDPIVGDCNCDHIPEEKHRLGVAGICGRFTRY
jgi:hypothetical protein